jgi:hypothetical protein
VPNTTQAENQTLREKAGLKPGKSYRNSVVDSIRLVHFDRTGMEFVPRWNTAASVETYTKRLQVSAQRQLRNVRHGSWHA